MLNIQKKKEDRNKERDIEKIMKDFIRERERERERKRKRERGE